jgi:hypothetical protein
MKWSSASWHHFSNYPPCLLILLSSDGDFFGLEINTLVLGIRHIFCRKAYIFLYISHSYNHSRIYAEAQLHFLHRCWRHGGSSLGCHSEIRTRACLTASRHSDWLIFTLLCQSQTLKWGKKTAHAINLK